MPGRRSGILIGLAIGGVVAVGTGIAGFALGATRQDENPSTSAAAPTPPSSWDLEQQANATQPDLTLDEGSTTAATPGPTLDVSLIKLTPKVKDKQCFGSAGCNVTVKLDMAYDGPTLAEDETWEVTYELRGGEDGPTIGTFEVTGKSYTVPEESVSTPNKNTQLTVKVTDVEKRGL
jgi:hypothetical protein